MTIVFAFLFMLLAAAATGTHSPTPVPIANTPPTTLSTPDQLFSRRALRQARLIIQLRILQLRDERLECVREALLRQLPSALWPEQPSPLRGSASAAEAMARCTELLRF